MSCLLIHPPNAQRHHSPPNRRKTRAPQSSQSNTVRLCDAATAVRHTCLCTGRVTASFFPRIRTGAFTGGEGDHVTWSSVRAAVLGRSLSSPFCSASFRKVLCVSAPNCDNTKRNSPQLRQSRPSATDAALYLSERRRGSPKRLQRRRELCDAAAPTSR